MANSLLRTDKEIAEIYERNVDTVYRVCFTYMKNKTDTEDMVQNTFLRLLSYNRPFSSLAHEKAWLIVTAGNLCKDFYKSMWHKARTDLEPETLSAQPDFEIDETLSLILSLPDKYKTAVYLYYYEGYSTVEIAKLLHKNKSTIRVYLHKSREILKHKLGGDLNEK